MTLPPALPADQTSGLAELALPLRQSRGAVALAVGFSCAASLLALTAPLYMLQVYDRVLTSRSVETLVALSGLMAAVFLVLGIVDHARGRIMARVAARLQAGMEARVLDAALRRLAAAPRDIPALAAERDLDSLSRFWGSPAVLALFDLPWTPLFLGLIALFHPLLGLAALAGGTCLVLSAWAARALTRRWLEEAQLAVLAADRQAAALKSDAEVIRALGMQSSVIAGWVGLRHRALTAGLAGSDTGSAFAVASRTFRLFLQSAMLGLAAWLVLRGELSAGAMVAVSVLAGRALQPVEQIVAHWPMIDRARTARRRLAALLTMCPVPIPRMALPCPAGRIEVQGLTLTPPEGAGPVLRGIGLTVQPGQALGVIGPSGAGKSALARALAGIWPSGQGAIRLDGAGLDQFEPEVLGRLVGYLPQRVTLIDGTVAQNIARFQAGADAAEVVAAARAAAAHDVIQRLPQGYDTPVGAIGGRLSGGQVQRIGLARALFGNPVLLLLDEPNAHLDAEGSEALIRAVQGAKAAGAAVILMAHRPAALQVCDLLMVLKDGRAADFGPRDAVLRRSVQNAGAVAQSLARGAVA